MTELFEGKLQLASPGYLMRQIGLYLKAIPPASDSCPMHMNFRIILKYDRKWQLKGDILGTMGHQDCPNCKPTSGRKTTSSTESV